MNPPGGVSLIIHIFIVLFGMARRTVARFLQRIGVADSRFSHFLIRHTYWLRSWFFQRIIAYTIILSILTILCYSVFISLQGIIEDPNNIYLIYLVRSLINWGVTLKTNIH